jgi:hypothetical protein
VITLQQAIPHGKCEHSGPRAEHANESGPRPKIPVLEVTRREDLSKSDKHVLLAMMTLCVRSRLYWGSIKTLAENARVSTRQVSRSLARLLETGDISLQSKHWTGNVYRIEVPARPPGVLAEPPAKPTTSGKILDAITWNLAPRDYAMMANMAYNEFLQTEYWFAVREVVLERDCHECRICGSTNSLQVHHRTYKNRGQEHNNLTDLITLCRDCHGKFHKEPPPAKEGEAPCALSSQANALGTVRASPSRSSNDSSPDTGPTLPSSMVGPTVWTTVLTAPPALSVSPSNRIGRIGNRTAKLPVRGMATIRDKLGHLRF